LADAAEEISRHGPHDHRQVAIEMELAPHAHIPPVSTSRAAPMPGNTVLKTVLVLFVISCIFDPADKLLGLKIDLFLACWLLAIGFMLVERGAARVDVRLFCYTLVFLAIPLFSVASYWLMRGGEPFEGWSLLKGYLLVSLALLLHMRRIDLMPVLCATLSLLAVAIIAVFVIVTIEPAAFGVLYLFGASTGVVLVDYRDYGGGVVMLQAYFVTSPMLAMAIAYYFHRAKTAPRPRARMKFGVITLLNVVAMLLAGTRNNLVIAILLPVVLHFMYARNKVLHAVYAFGFIALLFVAFAGQILQLLDPSETSNQLKLALLGDYLSVLDDGSTLLFGQGLGAYHYWDARASYFYISELTYLEMVRNFGLFGALAMFALLVFPLLYAFVLNRRYADKHLVVAYAFYLLMCMSNPNLFSSMGILILSIVLANIFRVENSREK
jgi:hypothetical protein